MASVPVLIHRIRRARRQAKEPPTKGRYRRYEADYRAILEELERLAGEAALDEVAEWTVELTRREQRLPTPSAVRTRARETLAERGVEIPEESPLYG